MSFIGRFERWLEKRKEEKPKGKLFKKRRKNLSIEEIKCPQCNHHKVFKKGDVFKCTKCSHRFTSS